MKGWPGFKSDENGCKIDRQTMGNFIYIHCYQPFAFLINRMIRRSWYSQERFWRPGRTVWYCWGGTPFKRTSNSQPCKNGTTNWTIWKSFNESTESKSFWSWFARFWYSGQDYRNIAMVIHPNISVPKSDRIFYNLRRIFLSRVQTQAHTTAHLQILQIHLHLRNILPTHAAPIRRPIRRD